MQLLIVVCLPLQCICTQLSLGSWCKFKEANLALVCAHLFLGVFCTDVLPAPILPHSSANCGSHRVQALYCPMHQTHFCLGISVLISNSFLQNLGFSSLKSVLRIFYTQNNLYSLLYLDLSWWNNWKLCCWFQWAFLCVSTHSLLFWSFWSPHLLQQHQHLPSLSTYLCI